MSIEDYYNSQIRKIAYFKWEEAGRPDGKSEEFWFEAEVEWINHYFEIPIPPDIIIPLNVPPVSLDVLIITSSTPMLKFDNGEWSPVY